MEHNMLPGFGPWVFDEIDKLNGVDDPYVKIIIEYYREACERSDVRARLGDLTRMMITLWLAIEIERRWDESKGDNFVRKNGYESEESLRDYIVDVVNELGDIIH